MRSARIILAALIAIAVICGRAQAWTLNWSSAEAEQSWGAAWGDYDNDGDLDQLIGNASGTANRVYKNNGACSFTPAWISTETDDTRSVAWGDYDKDGDLDQLVGNYNQPNRVYRNDGGDTFTLVWSSTESDSTTSIAWGDFDRDGDLDQLVGNYNQPNRVYRNNGGGNFALLWSSTESDPTWSIAWGDIDADGDLDQLVGNYSDAVGNRVYRNDGAGVFTLVWTSTELDYTQSAAWGNYDGDGDLDQLVGNNGQPNRVYRNDGGGAFTLVWSSPESDATKSVAWGDYDGDGDLDQLIGNGNVAQVNRVYRNNGGGAFALIWSSTETDQSISAAFGDCDGDRDLDQLIGNSEGSGQINRAYLNDLNPANNAPSAPTLIAEPDSATGTVTLQWNASTDDNTPAALLTYQIRIATCSGCSGVSSGRFAPPAGNAGAVTSLTFTLGNGTHYWSVAAVDSTGFATSSWSAEDVFLVDTASPTITINSPAASAWLNANFNLDVTDTDAGSGVNTCEYMVESYDGAAWTQTLGWTARTCSSTTSATISVGAGMNCRNEGVGACRVTLRSTDNLGGFVQTLSRPINIGVDIFTDVWTSTEAEWTRGIDVGDYDGDGDMDILAGNNDAVNRVYRNTGGAFSSVWSSAQTDSTFAVAWGDFDNDGDLDQLIGNDAASVNRVYRQDNPTTFTLVWSSTETDTTQGVDWGDCDNDGDPDQSIANNGINRVYRNNGGGSFTLAWTSTEADNSYDAEWGDYDKDGDFDLLVGNSGQANRVYRNAGDCTFTLAWSSTETDTTYAVAWGDYDGDGDLDQLIGNSTVDRIYRNDGGGAFTLVWTSQASDTTGSVEWGDYDADGDLDQLHAYYCGGVKVYRNEGGGNFNYIWFNSTLCGYSSKWGDYNGDGDLDIIVSDYGFFSAAANDILSNNLNPANSAPSSPTLTAEPDTGAPDVTLQWTSGADDHTVANLLTYQVRVGTCAGCGNIVSGRYTPPWGNAGATNSFALTLSASNRYYWSVSTVDTGYATSTWSAEDNFIYDASGPVVTINSPASGTWKSADFIMDVTNDDGANGVGVNLCYYRVLSNAAQTLGWTSYACGTDPTVTVGAAANCRDQGIGKCSVEFYSTDLVGNIGATSTRNISIDWDPPPMPTFNTPAASTWQKPNFWTSISDSDTLSGSGNCQYMVESWNGAWTETRAWTGRTCNSASSALITVGAASDCRNEGSAGSDYCRVVVRSGDAAGNLGPSISRTFKIDWTGPTITDNQTGDDTLRTINDGIYNVDFSDALSGLSYFQTRSIHSSTCNSEYWQNSDTAIGGGSYTTNWPIDTSTWNNMMVGTTTIYVRAYDTAGNASSEPAVFYVRKSGGATNLDFICSAPVTGGGLVGGTFTHPLGGAPTSECTAQINAAITITGDWQPYNCADLHCLYDGSSPQKSQSIQMRLYDNGVNIVNCNKCSRCKNYPGTGSPTTAVCSTVPAQNYACPSPASGNYDCSGAECYGSACGTDFSCSNQSMARTAPATEGIYSSRYRMEYGGTYSTKDTPFDDYYFNIRTWQDFPSVVGGFPAWASGCRYASGGNCWVRPSEAVNLDVRYGDAGSTPDAFKIRFSTGAIEVRSSWNVDTNAYSDEVSNDTYANITGMTAIAPCNAGAPYCNALADSAGRAAVISGTGEYDLALATWADDEYDWSNGWATPAMQLRIDNSAPSCSISTISETASNTFYPGAGTILYYCNTAGCGAGGFTVTAASSDTRSGVKKVNFPSPSSLTGCGDDTVSPYTCAFSFSTGTTQSGAVTQVIYDNVDFTNTCFYTLTQDNAAPTGGAVSYANGFASSPPLITLTNPTDALSGLYVRRLERDAASLSPITGNCNAFPDTWNSSKVTNPALSYTDNTVTSGYCYKYRYYTEDNVGNQLTLTSANVLKYDNVATTISINTPASGTWESTNFNVNVTNTDSHSGLASATACEYSVDSNGAQTKAWTIYTCPNGSSTDILITVGAGMDCRDQGTNKCAVSLRAYDRAGNLATASRTFSIDWTPPAEPTYSVSGCDYDSGTDCWMKFGNTSTHRLRHVDADSTPQTQYLVFTHDGCNPNACSGAPFEIKSYVNTDTGAFTDWMADDGYINITAPSCTEGGGCLGTAAQFDWPAVAGSVEYNYKIWTFIYDQAAMGNGHDYVGKWIKFDGTPPATTTAVTPTNSDGTFIQGTFDVTTGFSDTRSGVGSCHYCKSTDGVCDTEWAAATWTVGTCGATGLTCVNGQSVTLNMRAYDNVGNAAATGTEILRTCDTTTTLTSDNWIDSWTASSSVNIILSPSDTGSGVDETRYCVDGANACAPAATGTSFAVNCGAGSTCEQYFRYYSVDNAGNSEAVLWDRVRQDLQAPASGTIFYASGNYGTPTVPILFASATDGGSGLAAWEIMRQDAILTAGVCGAYGAWYTQTASPMNSPYEDTTVTNGNCYRYRLTATDTVGNVSTWCSDGAACTVLNEAAIDSSRPFVLDYQFGDNTWRNADPGAIYDVDFAANMGTLVSTASYMIWSGPGMSGVLLQGWTDFATGIAAASYTAPWGINWGAATEGYNYVSARCVNDIGVYSLVATDAFYVRKDTQPPAFAGVAAATDTMKGGTLYLSWAAAADPNGPIVYEIFKASSSGGQNFLTPHATSTATGSNFTGFTDDQPWYIVVRAVDAVDNSDVNVVELAATPTCRAQLSISIASATFESPIPDVAPVPGARIQYSIEYLNSPDYCYALTAKIIDYIPSFTQYDAGTILLNGAAKTDAVDVDECAKLAAPERIECDIPSVAAGATGSFSFKVTID